MNKPLAGTATVTLDGMSINVGATFRYSVGDKRRESLTGMSGIHGFKETYVPPFMTYKKLEFWLLQADKLKRRKKDG